MTKFWNEEMQEHIGFNRRQILAGLGAGIAAAGALAATAQSAYALTSDIPKFVSNGKKVKVGLGLCYGPFNQPGGVVAGGSRRRSSTTVAN